MIQSWYLFSAVSKQILEILISMGDGRFNPRRAIRKRVSKHSPSWYRFRILGNNFVRKSKSLDFNLPNKKTCENPMWSSIMFNLMVSIFLIIVSKIPRDLNHPKNIVGDIYTMSAWEWMMCITTESSLVTKGDPIGPLFGKTYRFHRMLKLLEWTLEII